MNDDTTINGVVANPDLMHIAEQNPGNVEVLLQNILESCTEYSIIGKDLEGTILLWNEGAVACMATAPKKSSGRPSQPFCTRRRMWLRVKELCDILPICLYCKKIRDEKHYWEPLESYIVQHTRSHFSHGVCPTCYEQHVAPDLAKISQFHIDSP